MGRIRAVFKADGTETEGAYSISEWWLEPNTKGPGAHSHPEDDVLYVIEGSMAVLVGDQWIDAPKGSFVLCRPESRMTSRTAAPLLQASRPFRIREPSSNTSRALSSGSRGIPHAMPSSEPAIGYPGACDRHA